MNSFRSIKPRLNIKITNSQKTITQFVKTLKTEIHFCLCARCPTTSQILKQPIYIYYITNSQVANMLIHLPIEITKSPPSLCWTVKCSELSTKRDNSAVLFSVSSQSFFFHLPIFTHRYGSVEKSHNEFVGRKKITMPEFRLTMNYICLFQKKLKGTQITSKF